MPYVKDLMTKVVVTTSPNKRALDAARLMKDEGRGCIVIVDGGRPVGILTERDFLRKVTAEDVSPSKVYVRDVMSKPLVTIDPDASVRDAARLMLGRRIRRLPVVKDNKLVGIIVCTDFARHMSKKSITEQILGAIARSEKRQFSKEVLEAMR